MRLDLMELLPADWQDAMKPYLDPGVVSVAFSPDGATLASTGADGTMRTWGMPAPARPGSPHRPHRLGVVGAGTATRR